MLAGIVLAVADDYQSLLVPMSQLQVEESFGDRVVECRSPARGDGRNGFFEFVCVICEGPPVEQFDRNVIIEINDEHFILRIAGLCESGNSRRDFRELGAHASAMVNDETDGHRSVFLLEPSKLLQPPILIDAEVRQGEPGNEIALRVGHPDRQHD